MSKVKMHHLLILDSSGSMGVVRQETIDGFNQQIKSIKESQEEYKSEQEHFVSLVIFGIAGPGDDKNIEYKIWKKPCDEVENLTTETYTPFGNTPLFDAIGMGIQGLRNEIKEDLDDEDTKVSVAIFTDGQENASQEFKASDASDLVKEVQNTKQWIVTFIGCDDNVFDVAESLGISAGNTLRYERGSVGTQSAFSRMSQTYNIMSRSVKSKSFENLSLKGLYGSDTEKQEDNNNDE